MIDKLRGWDEVTGRVRYFHLRNDGRGVSCDRRGVWLGGTCPLVWPRGRPRRSGHFVVRPLDQVRLLLKFAYGELFDADRRIGRLGEAAEALNDGDLPSAMLATLEMRLPDLPNAVTAERLAKAHHILAHNYDVDQPRDARGRWIFRRANEPVRPQPLRASAGGFTLDHRTVL